MACHEYLSGDGLQRTGTVRSAAVLNERIHVSSQTRRCSMREHRSMFLFVTSAFFLSLASCAAESTKPSTMTSPNSPTVQVQQVEGQPSSNDLTASPPTTQAEVTTPADRTQVQERAIRQGAGETGQCTCMRPAGQCVFSVLGGCVSHRGNPCNGGCIMQQSTPGTGGMAPASKGGAARGPAGSGTMAK